MKSTRFIRSSLILSAVGIFFSGLLLYHHVEINGGFQTTTSFCVIGDSFNCDLVAKSRFSEILGIPVASYGLLFYFVLFALTLNLRRANEQQRSVGVDAICFMVWLSLVPSLLLGYISVTEIRTICLYCSMLYLVSIFFSIAAFMAADRTRPATKSFHSGLSSTMKFVFSAVGVRSDVATMGTAFTSLIGIFVVAASIVVVPSALERLVFLPRQSSSPELMLHQQAIRQWELGIVHDLEISDRDFVRGEQQASITIVEFSDFECPHCREISPILKNIVDNSGGKIRLVFKSFPLDQACNSEIDRPFHRFACKAAALARCAGQSEKADFWKMHDAILAVDELNEEVVEDLPKFADLDSESITSCLESEQAYDQIKKDIALGNRLELRGTPAVYINGKAVSYPAKPVIEEIIKLADVVR